MTRSLSSNLVEFDPKIERTFCKQVRIYQSKDRTQGELSIFKIASDLQDRFNSDFEQFVNYGIMGNNNNNDAKTLKELVAHDMNVQQTFIEYLEVHVNFELKFSLIHLLPKFHGNVTNCPS